MSSIVSTEKPILDYRFPDNLIKLTYSKHAQKRLIERTTGALILAPKLIRLTSSNTKDVIVKNGRVVHATVFIPYKRKIWMFLPVYVPSGLVKTVYFDAKENTSKKRNKPTKEIPLKERAEILREIQFPEEILQTKAESRGLGENVGNVSTDMEGKKTFRWEKLLGIIRGIFRKRG